ncbi:MULTISPECIES: PAS domain S-box protein [Haloferax]|uniref:PAS domain S-box protein n=1 Tax=Haloferax TaxID=2251 RepID=UPI00177C291D|nr:MULTISPECIES: PAS domain S-box protein [Haloferax]
MPAILGAVALLVGWEHAQDGEPLVGLLLSVLPMVLVGVGLVFAGVFFYQSTLSTTRVWHLDAWLVAGALVGAAIGGLFVSYQQIHGATIVHANYLITNTVLGGAGISTTLGYSTVLRSAESEKLETTGEILDTVREINRQIATTDDRETLEQAVCETLAEADPYVFAWVGDVEDDELVQRASAGVEDGYLDSITITVTDGPTSRGPAGTAARTHESAVMQDIHEDPAFEPWRDAARERGYQSSMAVPLVYNGTRYGVLSIYADRKSAFDGRERAILEEVGDTLANSIAAGETRHREARLLNSMDDIVVVYSLERGEILGANTTGFGRLEYDESVLLGAHLSSFVVDLDEDNWFHDVESSDRFVFESTFETASGETFPVEVSAVSIQYEGEHAMLTLARDITSRREHVRTLQTYREAIEHAGHAIYITDTDGIIEYVNPAFEEQTGYTEQEVVGETPALLQSGRYDDEFYDDLWETILDGEQWHYEGMVDARKDGSEFYVDQTIAPIVVDDEVVRFVAINRDITDLKEYQRTLEDRNEQLELLNEIVRHDIRNDMQIVLGMSQLLEDHVDEDGRGQLASITEKSDHVVELTQTVGELMATLLTDETDGTTAISLTHPLNAAVDELAHANPDADIRIEGEIPSTPVCADEMVESVFRNILNNAIQHTRADVPEVVVSATEGDGDITVRIADNGPGIPESQRDAIFGKGERGLESSGTGLGLYLVQTLVDHYGGSVTVSDNDPSGAVFEIRLEKAT